MTYLEFKTSIQHHLEKHSTGATWAELRDRLDLPYDRPCPEWTRRLEKEMFAPLSEESCPGKSHARIRSAKHNRHYA
jgi:hypothetical protein